MNPGPGQREEWIRSSSDYPEQREAWPQKMLGIFGGCSIRASGYWHPRCAAFILRVLLLHQRGPYGYLWLSFSSQMRHWRSIRLVSISVPEWIAMASCP